MRKNRIAAMAGAFVVGMSLVAAPAAVAAPEGTLERVNRVFDRFGGRYNVITYRTGRSHTTNLNKPQYCEEAGGFRTVAFVDGTFVRANEGGYENWAFRGSWDRPNDRTVHFRVRTNASAGIHCNL
ncbi:hypothetical protein [Lentzea sp. E54]|uniref:hypothetical protein n=1 Tax=Lentzea xerophila TaxID=3435883 RepID=UPI003DA5FDD0